MALPSQCVAESSHHTKHPARPRRGVFLAFVIGPGESMSISRNVLFLIIGALIVTAGVLGYNLYQTKKQPDGVQINVGPNGLKIQGK
jgi:hypothetical protein